MSPKDLSLPKSNLLTLLAFAVCAFAIGTTEFVMAGVLPDIAREFSISIPTAGWLVTGYALGVTVSAPRRFHEQMLSDLL